MHNGTMTGIVAAVTAAALAFSGCLSVSPGDGVATEGDGTATTDVALSTVNSKQFADPAGDATDTGAGDAATVARCAAGQIATGTCLAAPAAAPPLGTPGPHLDIVGVGFVGETPDTAVFSLSIAKLSEGFPELKDPDGFYRMYYYKLCWAPSAKDACNRVVRLDVMGHGGAVHAEPKFEIRSRACNEWSWCSWGIEADLQFGAPAVMTFHVPKVYLGPNESDVKVHHLEADTGWISEPNFFPAWHPGVTVHTPAYHFHTHGGAVAGVSISDVTEPFPLGIALGASSTMPEHPADAPLLWGGRGSNHGAGSPYDYPEMDILWYDMHEDAGDLVAVFAIREFQKVPSYDFDYSVGVGVGKQVWEIGYRHEGGEAYGYSGRCIMEMCQDGKIMEPKIDLTFGAPGFIAIRTPLEFMGDPAPGTPTNLFWAMTMYSDVNYYWGEHDEDFFGDYHSVFMLDSLVGGAPYVFGTGHKAAWDEGAAAHHGH